jgi:hypothetical protein
VKTQILAASSEVTFAEVVSLEDLVSQSIGGRGSNKLMLIVATFFGTLAFTLAVVGIYGVVSHNVTQRLREIGIRIALGAGRRDIVRVVVGYGARLIGFGLALGLTAAWAATRGMRSFYSKSPRPTSTRMQLLQSSLPLPRLRRAPFPAAGASLRSRGHSSKRESRTSHCAHPGPVVRARASRVGCLRRLHTNT